MASIRLPAGTLAARPAAPTDRGRPRGLSWSEPGGRVMPMTSRRAARRAANERQPRSFDLPRTPDGHRTPVSAYFARHVLDIIKLKERLPREAYQALLATLRTGAPLS